MIQTKSNQIHSIAWSHDGVEKTYTIWIATRSFQGKIRNKRSPGIEFKNSLQVLKLKPGTGTLGLKGIDFNTYFLKTC